MHSCSPFTDQNSPLFRDDALNPKRNNGDDDQSNRIGIRRESAVHVLLAATVGVGIVVGHYRVVVIRLSLSLGPSVSMQCILHACFVVGLFWHLHYKTKRRDLEGSAWWIWLGFLIMRQLLQGIWRDVFWSSRWRNGMILAKLEIDPHRSVRSLTIATQIPAHPFQIPKWCDTSGTGTFCCQIHIPNTSLPVPSHPQSPERLSREVCKTRFKCV